MSLINEINSIGIPIPKLVFEENEENQKNILEYLKTMDEKKLKAYNIAFNHLGSSFNILKSNGYKDWAKNKLTK
jgi:hypothetical protein